ncbi:MAG: transketolase family protein [Bacteriovoracales bacterium]|nr:transketolase family protein [Bacteriovoracales bacterium]
MKTPVPIPKDVERMATRAAFGKALAHFAEQYPRVVCYDADLSKSTQTHLFAQKYPERFFQMGIQEANMVGAAAGISFTGKIPFACSFAAFLTGRYDQIRMSVGYSQANVKLVGTHCGVGIGEDGHSQMGLEDIALMRAVPGMSVLQPSTPTECRQMVEWAILHRGPVYLRLTRQGLADLPLPPFKAPGHFPLVKEGRGKAFLAVGALLEPALEAAVVLEEQGHSRPAVFNASSAKPLDDGVMEKLCDRFQELYVFEDHSVLGGTGSALAEWASEKANPPVRVVRYGVQDVFGESGTPKALYEKHGFTSRAIVSFLRDFPTLS